MNELLDQALATHGGMQRWQQVKRLTADVSVTGVLWQLKGWPDVFAKTRVVVDPHKQHTEYWPFRQEGQHTVWEPKRTAIVSDDGKVIEHKDSPRQSFAGHVLTTPWDAQQLIYFTGYAMWTYLTTPFLFTIPGFEVDEIEPWSEAGETWRRLKVKFPANVHSHSTVQTFYFDASGLLRRHDYSAEVLGGTNSCNYASDHKKFDGLVYATKRRIYPIGPDNTPVLDRLAISLDFHSIQAS